MIVNSIQKEITQLRKIHKSNQNLNQMLAEIAESLKSQNTQSTSQIEEQPIQMIIKMITHLPLQVQSISHSLSIIHYLQTINCLKEQDTIVLLKYLLQIQHPEMDLLIIRIMPPFFGFASLNNESYYSQIFTILFRLVHSTNQITQTTSVGALLQFTSHLIQEYQNQPHLKNQISNLFTNLVNELLESNQGIYQDLIMLLIQELGPHESAFEFDKLIPYVHQQMEQNKDDLHFNARRIRSAVRLVPLDLAFIKSIVLLNQKAQPYLKYWILEGIFVILQNNNILKLHQNTCGEFSYLQHLIYQLQQITEIQYPTQSTVNKNKLFIEDNYIEFSQAPTYSHQQYQKMVINTLTLFDSKLQNLAQVYSIQLGILNKEFDQTIQTIINTIWNMIYKIYRVYLQQIKDETMLQSILNSVQFWISLTGSIGNAKIRDGFVKFLSQCCMSKKDMAIQHSKTLFNVAHCLGKILDVTSWHLIFVSIQFIDNTFQDQDFIQSVVNNLFSKEYEGKQMMQMMDALNQLTLEQIEQVTISKGKHQKNSSKTLFGLNKMKLICKANVSQIQLFWEFFCAHIICVINCKNQIFREKGAEALGELLLEVFANDCPHQLLLSLDELVSVQHIEVKDIILQNLLKLLQINAHQINKQAIIIIIDLLPKLNNCFSILELIISQLNHLLEPQQNKKILILLSQNKSNDQNIMCKYINLVWQLADHLPLDDSQHWMELLNELYLFTENFTMEVRQAALHTITQIIISSQFSLSFSIEILETILFKSLENHIGVLSQLYHLDGKLYVQTPKFDQATPQFVKLKSEQEIQLRQQSPPQWEDTLEFLLQNISKILKKFTIDKEFQNNAIQLYDMLMKKLNFIIVLDCFKLKFEVIKLLKEYTQYIKESKLNYNLDIQTFYQINEFLFCKYENGKGFITRLLPELCQALVNLVQCYSQEKVIVEVFKMYQMVIEQPQKYPNVRIWRDEKQLWQYIEDFSENFSHQSDDCQFEIVNFILNNVKQNEEINQYYMKLFTQLVTQEQYLLMKSQMDKHQKVIQRGFMKYQELMKKKEKWKVYGEQFIQYCDGHIKSLVDKQEYFKQLMIPPDDNFSKKEMKECLDCEVDLCNYLRKYEDMYDLVYSYWEGLECNVDKNFADLAYEARQSFIQQIFDQGFNENTIKIIENVLRKYSKQLFSISQYQKEECIMILELLQKDKRKEYFIEILFELIMFENDVIRKNVQILLRMIWQEKQKEIQN